MWWDEEGRKNFHFNQHPHTAKLTFRSNLYTSNKKTVCHKSKIQIKICLCGSNLHLNVLGCRRCKDAGSAQSDDSIKPTWQQFKQSNYLLAPLHKSANHQTAAGHMTQLGRIFMAFALAAFSPGLSSPFVQDVRETYVHMGQDAAAVN